MPTTEAPSQQGLSHRRTYQGTITLKAALRRDYPRGGVEVSLSKGLDELRSEGEPLSIIAWLLLV
jgi:hypothetical protein